MHTLPERIIDADLVLRKYRPDEADILAAMVRRSADTLAPWLPWCHPDYGPDDAADFITAADAQWHAGGPWDFLVERDGVAVGAVRLGFIAAEDRVGNLGYWTDARQQGRGVATRAALLATRIAFDTLDMVRLELVIDQRNAASRRVAEKLGARFECVARNRVLTADGPSAAAIYSLVPGDLPG
jgi:ribosomal-protein-serine acetyltransferase